MASSEYMTAYEKENLRQIRLKINRKTEPELLEWLEKQDNIQGYIKRIIREDMTKEEKKMKTYIIKPDYIENFGNDANSMTVLTEDDVERLAEDWEMDVEELKDQLIEQERHAFRPIHRFAGRQDWQNLNEMIEFDSGVEEPMYETEDDYKRAVRDGFVTYDGYYTTIWVDD